MYRVVQLSNLIILGILTIVLLSANTIGFGADGFKVLELLAVVLFLSELLMNLVFMTLAICNFRTLLKQMPKGVKVNNFQLIIHFVLIAMWSGFAVWVAICLV